MIIDDQILDMTRTSLTVALKVVFPMLTAGIAIGLVISVVQSITQIQEQTLTMVPKIFAMVAVAIVLLPWIAARLIEFAASCFDLITPI